MGFTIHAHSGSPPPRPSAFELSRGAHIIWSPDGLVWVRPEIGWRFDDRPICCPHDTGVKPAAIAHTRKALGRYGAQLFWGLSSVLYFSPLLPRLCTDWRIYLSLSIRSQLHEMIERERERENTTREDYRTRFSLKIRPSRLHHAVSAQ